MTRKTRKRLILAGLGVVVVLAIVYGFLPEATYVDVATVERGPLRVTVEEEGETQVANTYVVSSPVAAYARRVELEAGDFVERGQPVVLLEPPRSAILDSRSEAQARARVAAAQAGLEQTRGQVQSAEAVAAEAREEVERTEGLFNEGSATQQQLTRARSVAEQSESALASARAAVDAAEAELTSARASLSVESAGGAPRTVTNVLYAPVSGSVLAVHHRSEGQVAPGEPLVEIGDLTDLQVQVDVLSQDAVRIRPGMQVRVEQWGGVGMLQAEVTRVEPRGFTDVSSLGVEEKRVTVVARFASQGEEWTALGAGYRVLAQFILSEADDLLLVPLSALYRTETGWAAFVVEGGTAVERDVEIGRQTGLVAEVISGLREGEEVVVHAPMALEPGSRVARRDD